MDGITIASVVLLFISVFLLIFSVFWLFYYGENDGVLAVFAIGITLGIIACILLIYDRYPKAPTTEITILPTQTDQNI